MNRSTDKTKNITKCRFKPGAPVIYRKSKFSDHPGLRARGVFPSAVGENYSYTVDKFWTVSRCEGDRVHVRTRRGKEHVLSAADPNLRRPSFIERLRFRLRFPGGNDDHAELAEP